MSTAREGGSPKTLARQSLPVLLPCLATTSAASLVHRRVPKTKKKNAIWIGHSYLPCPVQVNPEDTLFATRNQG
uniref:Putative secreted protein n=1 Tax=Anopheles darlingi TaxID=43151 RepID=A0A2M4DR22_ANODA